MSSKIRFQASILPKPTSRASPPDEMQSTRMPASAVRHRADPAGSVPTRAKPNEKLAFDPDQHRAGQRHGLSWARVEPWNSLLHLDSKDGGDSEVPDGAVHGPVTRSEHAQVC